MSINLETRTQPLEIEQQTAHRRFFVVPEQPAEFGLSAAEVAGQTLYKRTQAIHAWAPELGYPAFLINDDMGKTQAMVSTGLDLDRRTAVWQINVYDQGSILHGQTTEEGDRWQLIKKDHQGRLWQEATLWDKNTPGLLSSFVIGAINKVSGLDTAAEGLIKARAAKKLEYEKYRESPDEKEISIYWGSKKKDLFRGCIGFKFSSHDAISLQHMVEPNKDDYSRWHSIDRLPDMVRKLLTRSDYSVALLGAKAAKKATETE